MRGLNLSSFKKIKEDKHSVTMVSKDGHHIIMAKHALPAVMRKQLEKLPIHLAEGGPTPTPQPGPEAPLPEGVEPVDPDSEEAAAPVAAAPDKVVAEAPPDTHQPASKPTASPKASLTDSLNLNNVYSNQVGAIKAKTAAEAGLATDQAAIEHQNQLDLQDAATKWDVTSNSMQNQIEQALTDVRNDHIKPNHYLDTMKENTGQRIATGIGLLLGGFSSAFTHQGNPAMEWLNSQIDRDIAAQKSNQNNKINVYNGYLDQYKNAAVAENMAKATQLGIYASKIKEAADKAGTPMAQANGALAISQLQQQMIPLVQNAHLMAQASAFNGTGGGGAGSEAQYKTVLANAQRINPELYKDAQSKYVPGVGVASHSVAQPDAERLANMNELAPLIDKAIADQEQYGMTGAWSVKNRADANSDREAIQVSLNKMTGLNRLNDREYQNYGKQVGDIGGVNLGGTLQTLKNLKAQLDSDRNSAMTSMGITPFSQAQAPSGLNPQQQQVLQAAQAKYPNVSQGDLIKALREQGKI